MAWIIIAAGIFTLALGITIKIVTNEKDNNKRRVYKSASAKFERERKSSTRDVNNIAISNKAAEKYKQNQLKLERINSDLDQLISEISAKEKKLKRKLRDLNNQINDIPASSFNKGFKAEFQNLKQNDIPLTYQDALAMQQENLTTGEIAEALELGIRETELILKMHGESGDKDEK